MAQPKYEDMIMKRVMESFAQSGLRFLGITDEIIQPVGTELVVLDMQNLLMDYTFLMADGNYLHLEFQSTDKGEKDLRRFRKYEALLGDQKGKNVYTYVVYTNDIREPQTCLKTGFSEYRIKAITLSDWDSKQVIEDIKKSLEQNTLDEEQVTALAFVPVMAHSEERVEVISEAVKISHKVTDEQQKINIQSILFAFANKFLSGNELERIKEEIVMTQLGQMIYEDGIKKGEEKGEKRGKLEAAKALLDILSDEAIAKRLQIPIEQVRELRLEDQNK